MPRKAAPDAEWIWRMEMARRLGTTPLAAERIAKAAGVRILLMPGMDSPKYNAEDVARVLAESISVASR